MTKAIFDNPEEQRGLAALVEPWLTDAIQRVVYRDPVDGTSGLGVLRGDYLHVPVPELVHAIFRVLLGREPEDEAVTHYTSLLCAPNGVEHVLKIVMESEECRRRLDKDLPNYLPHPASSYDQAAMVFLHIQKTGGTSIQNMFLEAFKDQSIYREHADTLHLRSAAELGQYSMFLGHFNYDSISYIPKAKANISLVTFLREPKARLNSLYRFWRAHEPDHPSFHEGMALANKLDLEEFLAELLPTRHPETWNHITWVIMGNRCWSEWRTRLIDSQDSPSVLPMLLDEFRTQVSKRLEEFEFIGMQDDFDRSSLMLGRLLGNESFKPRHDHSVDSLIGTERYFKKALSTTENDQMANNSLINEMVQLDSILYEEAVKLYETYARIYG